MRLAIRSKFEHVPPILEVALIHRPTTIAIGAVLDGSLTHLIGVFRGSSRFNVSLLEVYLEVDLLLWAFAIDINLPYRIIKV